jgi:hypothetical protein
MIVSHCFQCWKLLNSRQIRWKNKNFSRIFLLESCVPLDLSVRNFDHKPSFFQAFLSFYQIKTTNAVWLKVENVEILLWLGLPALTSALHLDEDQRNSVRADRRVAEEFWTRRGEFQGNQQIPEAAMYCWRGVSSVWELCDLEVKFCGGKDGAERRRGSLGEGFHCRDLM